MPLSTTELLLIAAVVLLVFGAGWLPTVARRAGRATAEVQPVVEQLQAVRAVHSKLDRRVQRVARVSRRLP